MPLDSHPVSAALEAFLLADVNRHQIVIWLDPHDHYSAFVDALAARTDPPFGVPIVAHRGSYLECMTQLEPHLRGLDKPPLLVHVPRLNDDSIKDTPLYDVRVSGYPFRKSLDTLIREAAAGRVPPDEVERFLADARPTLSQADAWMATKVAAASGELTAMLQGLRPSALHDDLRTGGPIAARLHDTHEYGPLWHALGAHLGLPETWPFPIVRHQISSPRDVADALASWSLCVEYVHDLRRPPKAPVLDGLSSLTRPLVDACGDVARSFRASDPEAYARLALELEHALPEELAGSAADLGRVDTFRFEETQLFDAALRSLVAERWQEALGWAQDRLEGKSFWLGHDPTRKSAWMLVRAAAELGLAISQCRLDLRRATTLGEAAELYAEQGAVVDRLHRRLEQSREARLYSRIPSFDALRAALDATRAVHFRWADATARAFADLCEREGALPGSEHQQRRIFDDVVRPLLGDGTKTAFVLVDGLRFEMAQELLELIGKPAASTIQLRPRLAELPTVTEIGMNVLAPIADGTKLRPVLDKKSRRFDGFETSGSFRVRNVDTRRKSIALRAGGATCPWYSLPDLLAMPAPKVREGLRQARLVVVHAEEIDASGEKGTGLPVFAGAIRKLHRAWKILRDAGVQRFVFTSDHGFLLRAPDGPTLRHGQGYDALPRYALYPKGVPSPEQLAVSLRSLHYEDLTEHLLLPRGLAVYETYADRTYVHGGNSPAERVIPVLTLVHKRAPGSDDLRYRVTIERTGFAAPHCSIEARVEPADQAGLSFAAASELDLDLRALGDDATPIARHLVEARGGARLEGDVAQVRVGQSFELLFRLAGAIDARVPVELFHPSGTHQVQSQRSEVRFAVEELPGLRERAPRPEPQPTAPAPAPTPAPTPAPSASPPSPPPASETPPATIPGSPPLDESSWLSTYDKPGVRRVFAHIEKYSVINEPDLIAMLGGPRHSRQFSREFEALAERAPFVVRIDYSTGTKRYIKASKS